MKLLFITQKLHGQDAFGVLWANAFAARGYDVTVLCLEWQPEKMREVLPDVKLKFRVLSMGKERIGMRIRIWDRIALIMRFWKHILAHKSGRVFVHMAPVWGLLGAPVWILRRTPTYLWYTHYKMQAGLKLLGWYGKRLFCATEQSMPQYAGSPKKVVTGHGIDMYFWPQRENLATDPKKLLMVHRLARSKRVELCLKALTILPESFTIDIYGQEVESDYAVELKELVSKLKLSDRVHFHGSAAVKDLPKIYTHHKLILNMASETIDKTMLEAMTCGCYPVTTRRNADAIGLPNAPRADDPAAIANFIELILDDPSYDADMLYKIVDINHSLSRIVEKMNTYIYPGK